jgi:hypothetical protein
MSKLEQAINCSDGDQVAKAIQDARRHRKVTFSGCDV